MGVQGGLGEECPFRESVSWWAGVIPERLREREVGERGAGPADQDGSRPHLLMGLEALLG